MCVELTTQIVKANSRKECWIQVSVVIKIPASLSREGVIIAVGQESINS